MRKKLYFTSMLMMIVATLFFLKGCGFHLRGACEVPCELKLLTLEPNDPSDPFQRVLRQLFKANGIVIAESEEQCKCANILRISKLNFAERAVAYGPSNQVIRATLQFTFTYEVIDHCGNVLIPCNTIDVERDFTINYTNAILGTEYDRVLVKAELFNDASLLLIRQLSSSRICARSIGKVID